MRFTACILAVGAALVFLARVRGQEPVFANSASAVPRVAVLTETVSDGTNQYVAARYVHAVGADGSESLATTRRNAQGAALPTLVKAVRPDGVSFYLLPSRGWRSTVRLPYRADIQTPQRDPRTGCREGLWRPLALDPAPTYENEAVSGFAALRATSVHGKLRLTHWFSLAHGCELIRQTVETFDGDPRTAGSRLTGSSVQQLESIALGEPAHEHFSWGQAEERKPSEVVSGPDCDQGEAARLDALYATYRVRP
jgi:hypothetical protein